MRKVARNTQGMLSGAMSITPGQSRGARGMLGMSQTKLAEASRVSLRTILDFEVGKRQPIAANLAAIRNALEAAGAEFIPENGGGPGVRLRKPRP
jgi:transcriptional regulator with XRE-family HTH domain